MEHWKQATKGCPKGAVEAGVSRKHATFPTTSTYLWERRLQW
jgi:hypothetical protein